MSVAASLDNMRSEWRTNPRLRMGALAIVAVLWVYGILVLADWREALATEYQERHAYLARMQSLAGEDEWLGRAEEAARMRAALEAEIPAVQTVGLAQATVQSWARELAAASGADLRVQGQAADQADGHPGLYRVPVVISGGLPGPRVLELIRQVESYGSLAVVEESLILNRQNKTFSLTVVAYFQVQEAGDAGS